MTKRNRVEVPRRRLTSTQVVLVVLAAVVGSAAVGGTALGLVLVGRARMQKEAAPPHNNNLDEIIKEWKDHPVNAMERYGNRPIQVNGYIWYIDATRDNITVEIGSRERAGFLDPRLAIKVPQGLHESLKGYSKGQRIAFRVEFREMTNPPHPVAIAIEPLPG